MPAGLLDMVHYSEGSCGVLISVIIILAVGGIWS